MKAVPLNELTERGLTLEKKSFLEKLLGLSKALRYVHAEFRIDVRSDKERGQIYWIFNETGLGGSTTKAIYIKEKEKLLTVVDVLLEGIKAKCRGDNETIMNVNKILNNLHLLK